MSELNEQLLQISLKTFEELGFLMPIPEEDAMPADAMEKTITFVSFIGYTSGRLYIAVSNPILPVLAQNILAEENVPTQQQQLDALKEIANVICGNILPFLAGGDKIYRLSSPEITDKIEEKFQSGNYSLVTAKITFDEGIAELYWFYEKVSE